MIFAVACVCGLLFLKRKDIIVPFIYSGAGEITVKLFFSPSHLYVKHPFLYYHCFSVSRSLDSLLLA